MVSFGNQWTNGMTLWTLKCEGKRDSVDRDTVDKYLYFQLLLVCYYL